MDEGGTGLSPAHQTMSTEEAACSPYLLVNGGS